MCEYLRKIAVVYAMTLQKVQTFFHWRSCFYLVLFGQVRGHFGTFWGYLGKKWCLECFDL